MNNRQRFWRAILSYPNYVISFTFMFLTLLRQLDAITDNSLFITGQVFTYGYSLTILTSAIIITGLRISKAGFDDWWIYSGDSGSFTRTYRLPEDSILEA